MSRLPVIVGFGGINPAGRSSSHHGYRRLVIDRLGEADRQQTYQALAALMRVQGDSLDASVRAWIDAHTLIRPLETNLFDPAAIPFNRSFALAADGQDSVSFVARHHQLPDPLPPGWQVSELESSDAPYKQVRVDVANGLEILLPDRRVSSTNAGGQLPSGFDPASLYPSRSHPRGLQLTIYGASDALLSLGIDWNEVLQRVPGDRIAVYAASAMGQLDGNGTAGMLAASFRGGRVSSKNCALGLAEMVADFVNAYVLGSVGTTGANIGACATFLYNLRQGMEDIRSGRYRCVIVGAAEAPLTPEVMEGYRTMGALAEDASLLRLDGEGANLRDSLYRACRPFSDNCGFTLAEAAQFVVLFDDELALETGATVHGAVADVFVHADGFKKSISGPGIGNYLTMGKAVGVTRSILGDSALRHRTYVHAHGTGTPQNRVTESHIINELARTFGIERWPVAAIKSYLGHSLATASGDQLVAALGTWAYGIVPGIRTISHIADDVHASNLNILMEHLEVGTEGMDAALLNAKGFGGNNATASILAPHVVHRMLERKHGRAAMAKAKARNEDVRAISEGHEASLLRGESRLLYRFGEGVVNGEALHLGQERIEIPGHSNAVRLDVEDPYPDMR